jgi:hypothetical protein
MPEGIRPVSRALSLIDQVRLLAGGRRERALVTIPNATSGLAFNDWITCDADRWRMLGKLVRRNSR